MRGRHLLDFAALSLRALGGNAAAQGRAAETTAAAAEADGGTQLPTINVEASSPVVGFVAEDSATAMKIGAPVIETPASVSVVGAAEIAAGGGAANLGEAVEYMPGVAVRPVFAVWSVNYLGGLRVGSGSRRSGQFSVEVSAALTGSGGPASRCPP